jgi:hypothetical protein
MGTFQQVRISGATANSLIGEIIRPANEAEIHTEGENPHD